MAGSKFHLHPELSTTAAEPNITKINLAGQLFLTEPFTKFHENPTKDTVGDTKSQSDRHSPFVVHKSA
jgi:hypothetical protein